MLGIDQDTGSLTVGKFADILALDGNPLEDFRAMRSLGFVMKGGHVYRNDWGSDYARNVPLPSEEGEGEHYHDPF